MIDRQTTDPGEKVKAAVKLRSWNDFRVVFGGFLPNSYLAYAVRGFFATGGATCYVVRVGASTSPAATAAMAWPAATTPPLITYVGAKVTPGQSQIQLDSSDVVSPDQLISIGDPLKGECLSVMSIVDDQTIVVQPAPASGHAQGEAVYAIKGSAIKAAVDKCVTTLTVTDPSQFADKDLVSVEGGGRTEIRVVSGQPTQTTIQLSRALQFPYSVGAVVRKYDAAFSVSASSQDESGVRIDSPGIWGNGIRLEVTPLDPGNAPTRFSLRVTVDQGQDPIQPQQQEYYPVLSLDPDDPSPTPIYAPTVVNGLSELIQIDVASGAGTQLLVGAGPLATGVVYLQGGSDGTEAATVSTQDFLDALDVLGLVDDVAILCCPDAAGPPPQPPKMPVPTPIVVKPCNGQTAAASAATFAASVTMPSAGAWSMSAIQQGMLNQCASLQYRVAVLDTPMSLQPSGALNWLTAQGYYGPASRFAAVYYPWLKVPDELGIQGPNRTVPPSGHIAGAYAYTDNLFGVQKPPANVELEFVSDVELAVTDPQQGFLNPAGINAIRPFPGRGIRVWGARSISTDPDWRYIHVRRLMSMIEESVEKASQWVVFQSNDADLRRMLTHSLNVFLQGIWLTGGLKGTKPTDGYFVKCDTTNNPQSSIDAGRLICQVGVAIAAPMEFLVFELQRSVAGAQVVEA